MEWVLLFCLIVVVGGMAGGGLILALPDRIRMPLALLKAFEAGADAVFVAGCLEGECHYLTGNLRAKKRVNKLKKDLAQMG